jgi:hypothetical protein
VAHFAWIAPTGVGLHLPVAIFACWKFGRTSAPRLLDREFAEQALVRDEIKERGTYWAASEIWKSRRQVKSLRKQLNDRERRCV